MFALKKDMYSVWNHLSSSIRFVCFFIGLSFYLLAAGVHAATISQVSPNTGSTEGGTFVLIKGTDFTGATAVRFDGVPVAALNIHDATSMTVVTTAHAAGTVTVNAYRLTYHSSAQAAGTVVVKYTLSNKAGASPPQR